MAGSQSALLMSGMRVLHAASEGFSETKQDVDQAESHQEISHGSCRDSQQLNGRCSFQHGIRHLVLADVAVISYGRVGFEVVNLAASKAVRTWLCVG